MIFYSLLVSNPSIITINSRNWKTPKGFFKIIIRKAKFKKMILNVLAKTQLIQCVLQMQCAFDLTATCQIGRLSKTAINSS